MEGEDELAWVIPRVQVPVLVVLVEIHKGMGTEVEGLVAGSGLVAEPEPEHVPELVLVLGPEPAVALQGQTYREDAAKSTRRAIQT